jgi:hypothetical protein
MVRRTEMSSLLTRRTLPSERLEGDHQRVIVRMTRGGRPHPAGGRLLWPFWLRLADAADPESRRTSYISSA